MTKCSTKFNYLEYNNYKYHNIKHRWLKKKFKKKKKNSIFNLGIQNHCKKIAQKGIPLVTRLNIINSWNSFWYEKEFYSLYLKQDSLIKKYIINIFIRINFIYDNIEIHRNTNNIIIKIYYFKDKIKKKNLKKNFKLISSYKKKNKQWNLLKISTILQKNLLKITELPTKILFIEAKKKKISSSTYIITKIAIYMEQHNFNFKKALQTTLKEIKNTKKFKGIRVSCAGRLNKNARGKTEWFKYGQVSLTTINDNIKYSFKPVKTKFGICGLKVWLFF